MGGSLRHSLHTLSGVGIGYGDYTGWRTECRTIGCTHNTFLLLQKHLTSGTELILTGWKIVPNESL